MNTKKIGKAGVALGTMIITVSALAALSKADSQYVNEPRKITASLC